MIAGLPSRAIASFSASTGASAARLIDRRQARTRRVAQSSTTLSYTKPHRIGMQVVSIAQTGFGRSIFTPRSR